ncbi:MAG: hypothetical protein MO853_12645 [Candidatus Protistobacter heckmanni]|nr:hypothetical protein [Candidatus Protistobacter heckmanni]
MFARLQPGQFSQLPPAAQFLRGMLRVVLVNTGIALLLTYFFKIGGDFGHNFLVSQCIGLLAFTIIFGGKSIASYLLGEGLDLHWWTRPANGSCALGIALLTLLACSYSPPISQSRRSASASACASPSLCRPSWPPCPSCPCCCSPWWRTRSSKASGPPQRVVKSR